MAFLDYVLNYVSSVLMQSEDIWNFHSSLTLNKWKLAGSLWCFTYTECIWNFDSLSVLMQSEDIWNFHSSLTLNEWKLAGSLWCFTYTECIWNFDSFLAN